MWTSDLSFLFTVPSSVGRAAQRGGCQHRTRIGFGGSTVVLACRGKIASELGQPASLEAKRSDPDRVVETIDFTAIQRQIVSRSFRARCRRGAPQELQCPGAALRRCV